jgi:hypothetical protein
MRTWDIAHSLSFAEHAAISKDPGALDEIYSEARDLATPVSAHPTWARIHRNENSPLTFLFGVRGLNIQLKSVESGGQLRNMPAGRPDQKKLSPIRIRKPGERPPAPRSNNGRAT